MGAATAVQSITQPERGRTVGTRVRTTITPGIVIEVEAAELLDLERQGLIESREGDDSFIDDEPIQVESGVITDASIGLPKSAKPSKADKSTDTEGSGE